MADKATILEGQCRLRVDSTSQISLMPYNGRHVPVKVSGVWEAKIIPSSGVQLSNSGLTAGDLRYIYAFDSGGTLTLEPSATGHATDTDRGIEIKSGDATRTLVGFVILDTGTPGTFVDSTSKRWCINWYNRRTLPLETTFSADRTRNNSSFGEINTEIRGQFGTWDDEAVIVGAEGTTSNDGGGQASGTAIAFDSTSVVSAGSAITIGTNTRGPFGLFAAKLLSEGSHFVTLLGASSSGTVTWVTADNIGTGPMKTRLWAVVRG